MFGINQFKSLFLMPLFRNMICPSVVILSYMTVQIWCSPVFLVEPVIKDFTLFSWCMISVFLRLCRKPMLYKTSVFKNTLKFPLTKTCFKHVLVYNPIFFLSLVICFQVFILFCEETIFTPIYFKLGVLVNHC